jgi:hypothetical protein
VPVRRNVQINTICTIERVRIPAQHTFCTNYILALVMAILEFASGIRRPEFWN